MAEIFIKYIPSQQSISLRRKHPFAFLLLSLVSERARRTPDIVEGLDVGEAYIGDHKEIGGTRQNYRTALAYLAKYGYLQVIETCRTPEKTKTDLTSTSHQPNQNLTTSPTTLLTTKSTTRGTKVRLISSAIWDLNLNMTNHLPNHRPNHLPNHMLTTCQPPPNHELRTKERKNIASKRSDSGKGGVGEIAKKPLLVKKEKKEEVDPVKFEILQNCFASWRVSDDALRIWISKFSLEFILAQREILAEKRPGQVKNAESWMEMALKKDYAGAKKRIEINKKFAEDFKKKNEWNKLEILKQHCNLHIEGGAVEDYSFCMEINVFQDMLQRKLQNYGG